jgi:hypothetical protein
LLETDRPIDQALARARAGGLHRVIAVAGPIEGVGTVTLHDPAGGPSAEIVAGDLARLAREQAEGRRP